MEYANLIKIFIRSLLFAFCFFAQVRVHADMTTQTEPTAPTTTVEVAKPTEKMIPKPEPTAADKRNDEIMTAIKKAVQPTEPSKEIVILNTETGFVPEQITLKKGEAYKIHIVNLNMKEKNVSFLMDSFSQTHNTVYGIKKTFNIEPQVEGIYSYQCPETGIQGKLIVIKDAVSKMKAEKNKANF